MSKRPVARLTTPGQMVASLPLALGYVPTDSIVVACCYEPRGRMGLTMRFDLPPPEHEQLLASDIARRVKHQGAQRLLVVVYTDEPDGEDLPRRALFESLRSACKGIVLTEALLVRQGRFWNYVCSIESCCPAAGTAVDAEVFTSAVQLIAAENALGGRVVLPDRATLEATLAAPAFLQGQVAAQRCAVVGALFADAIQEMGLAQAQESALLGWEQAVARCADPRAVVGDQEAAALAMSLFDTTVRDQIIAWGTAQLPALLLLLEDLVRRTPAPFAAPICTVYGWVTYCEGGGAVTTIALERALSSDGGYSLALLLGELLNAQVRPDDLRKLVGKTGVSYRRAG